jgi:hypothetical protein
MVILPLEMLVLWRKEKRWETLERATLALKGTGRHTGIWKTLGSERHWKSRKSWRWAAGGRSQQLWSRYVHVWRARERASERERERAKERELFLTLTSLLQRHIGTNWWFCCSLSSSCMLHVTKRTLKESIRTCTHCANRLFALTNRWPIRCNFNSLLYWTFWPMSERQWYCFSQSIFPFNCSFSILTLWVIGPRRTRLCYWGGQQRYHHIAIRNKAHANVNKSNEQH